MKSKAVENPPSGFFFFPPRVSNGVGGGLIAELSCRLTAVSAGGLPPAVFFTYYYYYYYYCMFIRCMYVWQL